MHDDLTVAAVHHGDTLGYEPISTDRRLRFLERVTTFNASLRSGLS